MSHLNAIRCEAHKDLLIYALYKNTKVNRFNDFVFWTKNTLFRQDAMKLYKQALLSEKLPTEELNKINWEKRKKLIRFAYERIPFYKEYYDDNHFHPDMLKRRTIGNWYLFWKNVMYVIDEAI